MANDVRSGARAIVATATAPVLVVALYVAVPLGFADNLYLMSLIVASLTIGGVALAWALLGNLGGLVSFGHAAFFGVGSYTSAILVMQAGWPIAPAVVAGGVGAALSAVLILPALRLRGPYFALAILAYAHIFRIIATEWKSLTNGAGGIGSIPRFPVALGYDFSGKTGAYWIVLSIVLAFALVYRKVRDSDHGLALSAMHDSEEATRAVGVNSMLLKALMLFLSAFMTGVMGAFNAHYIGFLEPDYAFSGLWTMLPIVAAIFGGYRTIMGPIIGAVVVYLVDQLVFKALMPIGHQIMLGALLGAMILWSPGGLLPALSRRLPRRGAVSWLSLTVGKGEIVGLVGPNGAGKTTLFNVLSGTVRPQRGTLRFDGVDLAGLPPYARARRGLGRTFQIPQPMHRLTVAQNIRVAQRFGGRRVDRKAQDVILELVGLADRADRDAATGLSLTELKALEVAKALATEPRVLLLDEALAGLEVQGKRMFTQLLARIHVRFGLAIVIIEHDIEAISSLCPRVAVLDFGRLIADGSPLEVFCNPAVVASYTGVPADA